MPYRCRRSPTFGFPLRITPPPHSHLLTRISRHPKNAHFSVKSNPGALIVKVRRISCSRSSPNRRSIRCAFYLSLHPTHPVRASRLHVSAAAILPGCAPIVLFSCGALFFPLTMHILHISDSVLRFYGAAPVWQRLIYFRIGLADLREAIIMNRDPILLLTTAIDPPSLDLCPYARKRQCAAQS